MFFKKINIDLSNLLDKESFAVHRNDVQKLLISNGKLQGQLNFLMNKDKILLNIQQSEFQIFSQWGDDGIIDFLCRYLDIPDRNKIFVEFGVESYVECNTRFLLINNNWEGLVIDGSSTNIQKLHKEDIVWKFNLTAVTEFITKENINELLRKNNIEGEIGLLHIDIDGNDYWIWKEINVINPIIVIIEYNSVFGNTNSWTIPYHEDFDRTKAHFSNLYYGVSLKSLIDLGGEKGYSFIGCNSNGNNAYFIRNDKLKQIKVRTLEDGYVLSKFSESKDQNGKLSFLKGGDKLLALKELDIYDTSKNSLEKI